MTRNAHASEGSTVYVDGEEYTVDREYDGVNVRLTHAGSGDDLLADPSHITPAAERDATTIDGIGEGRAATLADHGIETVGDIISAGPSGLVDAGLAEARAEEYHEAAVDLA